jgi:uncharacterized protein (DUF2141 family)
MSLGFSMVALALPFTAHADGGGQLSLRVEKLRNDKGRVLCLLFASQDGFPLDAKKALASTAAKVQGGVAVCEFKGLAAGQYAICGFHDENDNEELDLGRFGIPKEGIVSSRSAPARFGPPKYKDAVFDFAGEKSEQRARIHYYL